jgi:hypothetical protein
MLKLLDGMGIAPTGSVSGPAGVEVLCSQTFVGFNRQRDLNAHAVASILSRRKAIA